MIDINYFQLVPSGLSVMSTFVFICCYFKYKSIKYAFGMNYYIVILSINFFMSIFEVLQSFTILLEETFFCMTNDLVFHYLVNSQTVWIGFYYLYLYKVVFLGEDKDQIKQKKAKVFIIIFPAIEPILYFIYNNSQNITYKCIQNEDNTDYGLILDIFSVNIALMLIWCSFASIRIFMKLKSHYGENKRNMKWIAFRLIFLPLLTFICFLPYLLLIGSLSLFFKVSDRVLIYLSSNFCLLGFYNFISLIINPEFKAAVKLEKNISCQNFLIKFKLKLANSKK